MEVHTGLFGTSTLKVINSCRLLRTQRAYGCVKCFQDWSLRRSLSKEFVLTSGLHPSWYTLYEIDQQCRKNLKDSVKLKGEDAWKCPKCNEALVASKRFYFDSWSDYLIIGLKRFYYKGTRYVKNSNPVEIPLEWRQAYKLKGAIIHSGSLHGGHYICVGQKDNNWYVFNDSSVSKITSQRVLTNYLQNSYFILYQK